jgi:tetratricopeptide (TPR) repeat protein
LKWIISEYIKHHKDNVFSSLKPGKLYRQLELLFFTGHAVKNLKLLQELNLFEELFGYVRTLLAKDKELTLYLVQRVCEESDQDASLWPSLLFYAIHWNSMKKRTVPYDLERISRISRPTIQFYHFDKEMQAIRVNQDKNGRDVLNESIHQSILAFLVECEEAYKNRLINQDAMTLLEEIFPGAATLERSESELYLDKSNASSEDNITTSESDLSGEFEFPALRSDKEATDEVLNHFVSEEVAGIFSQILDGQLQEESDIATENRLKQLTNEILNKILNEVTAEKPFEMVSEVLNELIQEELETAAEYWFLRGKSLAQQNTHQDPAQKAAQEILTLASYEKALSIESHHILAHQACIDIYSKTKTALLPNLSSKKLKKETQKKIKNINEKILQHCNALIDIPKETYTLLCAADTGLPEYSDFIYSVTCQRAEIYFALGKNNNAMNDWLQAREHNITKGNYAEALVCYKKILAINPHHLPILKEYITISMELDDEIQREALNYCTTLIEHEILEKAHDSLRYWAYCQQGKIFTTLGEYKKARASFKSAAALNAKLPEAYYKIADLIKRNAASESNQKKQNELYIQATNSYNEALKYDPECSVAHWGLGEIAEAQGDLDKAEECYQKSLGIKSEKSIEAVAQRKIVQQKKAALAIKTDENSRAITPQIVEISDSGEKTDKQVFADVIQLTAMEAEAIAKTEADSEHWFQLARENHRHCQYEQAKASYKKTLEINSQHILARRYLVDLYILLNRPTEALTEANFLIEINQSKSDQFDYYHALYQRGRVHLMTNQVDRAKQDLDRVIAQLTQKKSKKSSKTLKNSPQELKWSNLLAHVYFSMGEWVEVQLRTEREKFKAPEMLEIEYIGTEKDGYQAYQKPKVSADRTHENETITQTILELENQAKTFYEKSLDYLPLAQVYAALGNLEKARALTCFVYVNIYKN